MKYSQAKLGRTFVVRLEDGDVLHQSMEKLAAENNINAASVTILGGADKGSRLVVAPEDPRARKLVPMEHVLEDVAEITGTGTIFPDEAGKPVLHMHISCGRGAETISGCVRKGVLVWQVMEVVVQELLDSSGVRRPDAATGFELLQP
jgi:predicted DNA-binding protein with PD1-like motif